MSSSSAEDDLGAIDAFMSGRLGSSSGNAVHSPPTETPCPVSFPSVGWSTLQSGRRMCPEFTVETILSLFLNRTTGDGKPTANFKSICGGNKAMRLFQAGYVSKIRLARIGDKVFFPRNASQR